MKGGSNGPNPKKNYFKKPSLIRVKTCFLTKLLRVEKLQNIEIK